MRFQKNLRWLALSVVVALPMYGQWETVPSSTNIHNTNSGNVGIGTQLPDGLLTISGNSPYLKMYSPFASSASVFQFSAGNNLTASNTLSVYSQYTLLGSDATPNWLMGLFGSPTFTVRDVSAGATRLAIDSAGNVGIGTTSPLERLHVQGGAFITGDLVVNGNIAAKYQDVAEWVPAEADLAAGTVVALMKDAANTVGASSAAYDTSVAGVVSSQPGIALGVAGPTKALIATTGRVKVHVDASKGPIAIGDLLVTSAKRGTAMRSEPVNVAGIKMHRPGTIIGKALEPLRSGEGDILVLLSLQ
jgi:hypothetical protein